MMQTMRNLAQSWLFKGLMLLVAVSFSIWGIGDIFRGNPLQRPVARVGKLDITVQTLDRAFEGALSRARQMFGPELTPQQAKQIGLLDQTLNNLIQHASVEQDVDRLGIAISQRDIITWMAAQPNLRNPDGSFNKDLFRRMASNAGMGEAAFIESAAHEMAQKQLFDAIQSSNKLPQIIVDSMYRARGQKRILDVVTLKNASFGEIATPDDKVLHDYYDQNTQKFLAPEYRAVTIARLGIDDVAKDISIGDEDVKKAYDAKLGELAQPELRTLDQVVLQDEARAQQLAKAAKADRDLAKAAKAMGLDAVPLDPVDDKGVLPELAKPVFALPLNGVSDPIKSSLGWHVVQVKKITPGGTPEFKDIKDKLREDMKRDQAVESITRTVNGLDDSLAAGHALEDIADGMKLRLVKIAAIDANGKLPDGKDPAELPARDIVLKNAFAQNTGEVSPVLDDKSGNYIVVRVDEVTPAAAPPFDTIKDRVTAAWKANEQAKRSAAAAETIAKGLREGKPASSFATQNGVDVRVSKPISLLGDSDPSLPQQSLAQILQMKKGEAVVLPLENSQLVLRLAELVDADPAGSAIETSKVSDEVASQMSNELATEYIRYLHVLFPAEINQNILESVRQQGGQDNQGS